MKNTRGDDGNANGDEKEVAGEEAEEDQTKIQMKQRAGGEEDEGRRDHKSVDDEHQKFEQDPANKT